jgi:hypothetical protein
MVRLIPGDFRTQVLAVNRVEELLHKVTKALDNAKIPYAVIGGNAVSVWVSTVDSDAVRATKDVDVMIRRHDLAAVARALEPEGLIQEEVLGITIFVDRIRPSPKSGLHILFANERVNPHDKHPTPDVGPEVRGLEGYRIVDLPGLVTMKLQVFRLHDRVHILDLASVGLIDESFADQLPEDLRPRLMEVLEEGRKQGLGIHGRPPAT